MRLSGFPAFAGRFLCALAARPHTLALTTIAFELDNLSSEQFRKDCEVIGFLNAVSLLASTAGVPCSTRSPY